MKILSIALVAAAVVGAPALVDAKGGGHGGTGGSGTSAGAMSAHDGFVSQGSSSGGAPSGGKSGKGAQQGGKESASPGQQNAAHATGGDTPSHVKPITKQK